VFIKDHITGNVDTIGRNMKTLITLMHGTIAKEHTLFGPKLEFATIVRAKMRPACAPKHFEE
jgi:hypothetical protein